MLHALLAIGFLFTVAAGTGDARLDSFQAAAPQSIHHHVQRTVVITLQRTVCYGSCPEYKLTIFSDGRVLYEGIRNVKKKERPRDGLVESNSDN